MQRGISIYNQLFISYIYLLGGFELSVVSFLIGAGFVLVQTVEEKIARHSESGAVTERCLSFLL